MIIVNGWVRFADAGEIDRACPALAAMVAATLAEPGCLAYAYAVDLGEPALLHIVERWTDDAALAAHFATPHMAAFGAALAAAAVAAASVKAYAGEEVRTLLER